MSSSGGAPVSSRSCLADILQADAGVAHGGGGPRRAPGHHEGDVCIFSSKAPMFLQYDPCAPRSSP